VDDEVHAEHDEGQDAQVEFAVTRYYPDEQVIAQVPEAYKV